MLVRTMGVTHVVCAINKMDDKTVGWSKKRYDDMVKELSEFLKRSGFKKEQVRVVDVVSCLILCAGVVCASECAEQLEPVRAFG